MIRAEPGSFRRPIAARSLALFGKRDGSADYSWLRGAEDIPSELSAVCTELYVASNGYGVILALVTAVAGRTFLLRTFRQGLDNAYRPILALEIVAPEEDDGPLAPPDWVGLAAGALQRPSQESAGKAGALSLEVPALAEEAAPIEAVGAFRLGVPQSVSAAVARGLLRSGAAPPRGILFAPELKGGATLPWKPFAAPFLAVHFGPPALDDDDRAALATLNRRPPGEGEWQLLLQTPPERRRAALGWALAAEGAPPLAADPAGDPLLPWLAWFRRQTASGVALLRILRRDLGTGALPDDLLAEAFPDLTPGARRALQERRSDSAEILEELAHQGLLEDADGMPLQDWARAALGSPVLREKLLRSLCAGGASEVAGRLALGGDLDTARPPERTDVRRAATIVESLSLPLSLPLLRLLLDHAASPRDLETAMRLAASADGTAQSLARIALLGELPAELSVEPADLVRALEARARALPRHSLLPLVGDLLDRGWTAAALAVLAAVETGRLPQIGEQACALARARLGSRGPLPIGLDDLVPLVDARIARPEHVIPPSTTAELSDVAALWPQTRALAAVLRGTGPVPATTVIPAPWREPLRSALGTAPALRWLRSLPNPTLSAARTWLGQTLDLPPALPQLFAGETPTAVEAEEISRFPRWIAAFSQVAELAERLDIVVRLAQAKTAASDDRLAEDLTSHILSGAGDELRALAVHLLSDVGPMPPLATLSPESLRRLVPAMRARPLVDALFVSPEAALTQSEALVDAVVERMRQSEEGCPWRTYTHTQIARHPMLACGLAKVPGWERVTRQADPPAEEGFSS
jgi:hypothetical protein